MATTTNLLTWEEFERLPDEHLEIIEGELITLPPPKSGHSTVAANTFLLLQPLQENRLGRIYQEAGYKLSQDPATWIQPDVSFLKMERVRATKPNDHFLGAPELAVEVVSPSETAQTLNRKIDLLLAGGSLAVWVIYPGDREVRVFLPDGTSFRRGIGDTLTAPELLPGWELPVARLFEEAFE
ncbi:MAG: Uma2 family endonuclease [Acidobacteriia bacterium]|nr:Uma2 family endonuclease [Terriglobia bacterium]